MSESYEVELPPEESDEQRVVDLIEKFKFELRLAIGRVIEFREDLG